MLLDSLKEEVRKIICKGTFILMHFEASQFWWSLLFIHLICASSIVLPMLHQPGSSRYSILPCLCSWQSLDSSLAKNNWKTKSKFSVFEKTNTEGIHSCFNVVDSLSQNDHLYRKAIVSKCCSILYLRIAFFAEIYIESQYRRNISLRIINLYNCNSLSRV